MLRRNSSLHCDSRLGNLVTTNRVMGNLKIGYCLLVESWSSYLARELPRRRIIPPLRISCGSRFTTKYDVQGVRLRAVFSSRMMIQTPVRRYKCNPSLRAFSVEPLTKSFVAVKQQHFSNQFVRTLRGSVGNIVSRLLEQAFFDRSL